MRICKHCNLPKFDRGEISGYAGPICQHPERVVYFEPKEDQVTKADEKKTKIDIEVEM